ncbi:TetR/AcrR family transcriptional regulator [Demequina sp. SYSU T00039]|uniref:TetR/AcrR family transcriptional regulator n=1 Tax=Demequina lignilytica TaxID=3051663 RepID=A0AAW7M7R2_9MICO|nr:MULTISPECIES: TetR/AcrR family transcriptional regulator [unclassified Demequina]MDN4479136.1 TetR/AcrR family transcriptional regulator [Demequina sp. SYSU T00039-1]MDN4489151.1 TetR/AcrR family transcriptional regulator [Demequina sp. SYSU T00039]MDN4490254.1 TetR/AcrR family transcriptional regulator [Demequina sp. SYSU T00068]
MNATRAPRMSPEDRRAHIVAATVPLILEHGAEVTTRQIADAAGIAEGTVFRAFADKHELIDACIAHVMDPADSIRVLEGIDGAQPLEAKIEQVVTLLHDRVGAVVRFMTALGPRDHERHRKGRPGDHHHPPLGEVTDVVTDLLAPDADRLRVPVATAVEYLRILVFGTAMPFLSSGAASDPAQLATFILHGIAKEGD